MKTTTSSRSVILGCVWFGLCCVLAGVAVWLFFDVAWGVLVFWVLFFICLALCVLHQKGYSVELTDRELIITRGFFLHSILKIPLRFVSATACFSTPLCRMLGVGVLTVSSSGRLTMMIGLPLADIERLRAQIVERQV